MAMDSNILAVKGYKKGEHQLFKTAGVYRINIIITVC